MIRSALVLPVALLVIGCAAERTTASSDANMAHAQWATS